MRAAVGASVLLGLVSTAAVVVQALALAHLLAGAMPHGTASGRLHAMVWLGAGLVVRGAAAFAGEVVARLGAAATKAELRRRLLATMLSSSPRGPVSSADVAVVSGRGLDALDVYVGRCLPDLVLAAAAPIALVVAAAAVDWISALVLLAAVALFPLFGALVGKTSAALAADRWRRVEVLGRRVGDVFAGLPTLRAFGQSAAQRARIAEAGEALRVASTRTLRVAFLSAFVLDTLASVSVALVAVPLGLRLLGASVSLPAALAVLVIAPEVFVPLRRASAEFHESTEGLAALGRVLPVLDVVPEPAAPATPAPGGAPAAPATPAPGAEPAAPAAACVVPDPARVPVRLEGVRVEVPGSEEPLLGGADLVLEPGETVVLLGDNGAGKSTVCSLLLGFRRPDAGAVTVGGADLQRLDPAAWRRRLAYLPEHATLLDASLADNLRLARPDASDEELGAALRRAGAADLADALPDGLATRLGAGGRQTSAGERQRIALARILLRPASLLVLDEPTVHLDPDSEDQALLALAEALEGRTALVVTHRPAALRLGHRVVCITGGRFEPLPRTGTAPTRAARTGTASTAPPTTAVPA